MRHGVDRRVPAERIRDGPVQGLRVGEPLSHSHAARRLKRLGVRPLEGRTAALLTLAAALPPPLLAEMLGISETSAGKWYRLAGGEWSRYPAGAARRSRQPRDRRPDVTDLSLR
jgi:hypothetical protein